MCQDETQFAVSLATDLFQGENSVLIEVALHYFVGPGMTDPTIRTRDYLEEVAVQTAA